MTKKNESTTQPVATQLSTGAWTLGPTTTIICDECGKERIIKIQDAFQVHRCAECQKAAQKKTRNEAMKAKKATIREAKAKEAAQAIINSYSKEELEAILAAREA